MNADVDRSRHETAPLKRGDLVHPELSYKIVGALYDVYNAIGPGHLERVYQKAVTEALKDRKLTFAEQVQADLVYKGKPVGKYFLDFLVENAVVLELKQGDRFRRHNIEQTISYLKATNLKLAILANFNETRCSFPQDRKRSTTRFVNSYFREYS